MIPSVKVSKNVDVPLRKLKEWKSLLKKEGINSKSKVLNEIDKVIKDWERL